MAQMYFGGSDHSCKFGLPFYLVLHRSLLHKIQILRFIVVSVAKMCVTCMLTSVSMQQVWRWVVELLGRNVK